MAAPSDALKRRLESFGELDQSQIRTPALTIDEFFVGNDDEGSIGCNLVPHPGIDIFEAKFRSISSREDVFDIRFPVTEFIDGLDWPFVDNVVVVTTATSDLIFDDCRELKPDEAWIADDKELERFDGLNIPDGYNAVIVWWD